MHKELARCIIIAILFLIPFVNVAQPDTLYLGTKTPYPSTQQVNYTAPPPGFKPVFINYTGRHGARFLTKPRSDLNTLQLLLYAKKNNQLTPLGKRIIKMAESFLTIEKNNYENISLLGEKEQAGIGQRIHDNYPGVFRGNGIDIMTTHKVRTQQSARAFLKSFNNYRGEKKFKIVPDSLDNVLRFFDLAPAYLEFKKDKKVRDPIDSLNKDIRTKETAEKICYRVFAPGFAKILFKDGVTIKVNDQAVKMNGFSFAENLYELYSVQFSIPGEMKQMGYTNDNIDFSIAFDRKDLAWFDFKNGAEDFLEKGAGLDTLGVQVRVAIPLLADYITTTNEIINKTRATDAIFRFTHAEAIAPFATLLGIPSASVPSSSIYEYDRYWKPSSIIPLSANIQWIIFTNGKEYLVKVLLNEKETALPISTAIYPFYKWEDVKNYYTQKMKTLNVAPGSDMSVYLSELK